MTLLDDDGSIILNEAWDTRKYKNFFEKVEYVEKQIESLSLYKKKIKGDKCQKKVRLSFKE